MSHLKVFITKSPNASSNPGGVLGNYDTEQFARIPCVGERITITDTIFMVEEVVHVPYHGVAITVI